MMQRWHRLRAQGRRIFHLVVLFCVLRFVAGFAMIAIFDRGAVARGPEVTVVIIAAVLVYAGVALIVRHASGTASSS